MSQTLPKGRRLGQITVFIVLAVVVVILLAMLYSRVASTEQRVAEFAKTSEQWDVSSVNGLVQGCLSKVATDSVFYFGMVGGKTEYFHVSLIYDENYKIPYYFWMGVVMMPSKQDIERDILGTYVASRLKACTAGFKQVHGFNVTEGDVTPKVTINENTVDFVVSYPIELRRGDQKTVLKDFSFRLPSRLNDILNIASEIVNREVKDDTLIHWDYMTDITNRGYNITAHAEQIHTIVYRIVDPESLIYFEPYTFQFANRVRVEG